MVILDNLLFIHIPKCAGTSISSYVWSKGGTRYIEGQDMADGHTSIMKLRKNYDLSKYVPFAIVRNPFEIVVSHFQFSVEEYDYKGTFVDFCKLLVSPGAVRGRFSDYVDDSVTILRFENLYHDLVEFGKKHGHDFTDFDRKLNTSDHKHYSEYYEPFTKGLISKYFKDDLEKYGYSF